MAWDCFGLKVVIIVRDFLRKKRLPNDSGLSLFHMHGTWGNTVIFTQTSPQWFVGKANRRRQCTKDLSRIMTH